LKFLLNMNLPRELGRMLASVGHEWQHVADIGMARAADASILAEARGQGECVLTHDLDYGQLLAFSGDSAPSVVIFRLRRADVELMFRRETDAWGEIEDRLKSGAIVIIEEASLRHPTVADRQGRVTCELSAGVRRSETVCWDTFRGRPPRVRHVEWCFGCCLLG
jgi:predicted nuclease of predicted toxin-antitoxin system